jgi:hypothetical protein
MIYLYWFNKAVDINRLKKRGYPICFAQQETNFCKLFRSNSFFDDTVMRFISQYTIDGREKLSQWNYEKESAVVFGDSMSALGEWIYSTIQTQYGHFVDMSGHIKVSTVSTSAPID